MGNLKPAPVVYEVQHGPETWRVYRTSRHGYEVIAEQPLGRDTHLVSWNDRTVMVWVSGHRWLWRAKRRANRGGEA
jgi:hypothetical protein